MGISLLDALEPHAKHAICAAAQVENFAGTNITHYHESLPLDRALLQDDAAVFYIPGNYRGRLEFWDLGFGDFADVQVGTPQIYDREEIVVWEKEVDNRYGKSDIATRVEWSEDNKHTQEEGFKNLLSESATVGFEAGGEFAKINASLTASASQEWDNRDTDEHSEKFTIEESVATPPGVWERIEAVLSREKVKEHVSGFMNLKCRVHLVSQRPDHSYYYVLAWESWADFLRVVNGTAPESFDGAAEFRNADIRQFTKDCLMRPCNAPIDRYNQYEHVLNLSVRRIPLG